MLPHATALGFLEASRAQSVSRIIGKTERLVATLGLAPSDLECAEEALRIAKTLFAVHDFSQAAAQARRAGAIAVSLNDRFNAYVSAWKELQKGIAELEQLGFPTESLETAVGEAEEAMLHLVEEEGAVVPDYLGATARLERAAGEARAMLIEARQGSREIFLATLATEALSGETPSEATTILVDQLEKMIAQATEELARGSVTAAATLASEARRQADELLVGGAGVHESTEKPSDPLHEPDSGTPAADDVRSEPATAAVSSLEESPASGTGPTFSDEAVALIGRFARAQGALNRAERICAILKDEGFSSNEADEALLTARRAADAGDWSNLRGNLGKATRVFVDRRNERVTLAREITDLEERLVLLKDFRLPLLPAVHEAVEQAKESFRRGMLTEAREHLTTANALMIQATRTGS